jgi:hypothetical protein
MPSTYLGWFQLTALALMHTGCSLIERDGKKGGVYYCVGLQRSNVKQEKKIMINLHDFTLCDGFLEHKSRNTCM